MPCMHAFGNMATLYPIFPTGGPYWLVYSLFTVHTGNLVKISAQLAMKVDGSFLRLFVMPRSPGSAWFL